jgi:hypothetical protein
VIGRSGRWGPEVGGSDCPLWGMIVVEPDPPSSRRSPLPYGCLLIAAD